MATTNPKIQGYIKPSLYDKYEEFKKDRGITKDSEALNVILSEFFSIESDNNTQTDPINYLSNEALKVLDERYTKIIESRLINSINPVKRRLDEVESRLQNITSHLNDDESQSLSHLKDDPLELDLLTSNSPSKLLSNQTDHLSNNLEDDQVYHEGNLFSESLSTLDNTESNLESNLEYITSHLNEAESNLESNLESDQVEGNLFSESLSTLDEVEGNLEADQDESILLSNLDEVDSQIDDASHIEGESNLESESLSHLDEVEGNLFSESLSTLESNLPSQIDDEGNLESQIDNDARQELDSSNSQIESNLDEFEGNLNNAESESLSHLELDQVEGNLFSESLSTLDEVVKNKDEDDLTGNLLSHLSSGESESPSNLEDLTSNLNNDESNHQSESLENTEGAQDLAQVIVSSMGESSAPRRIKNTYAPQRCQGVPIAGTKICKRLGIERKDLSNIASSEDPLVTALENPSLRGRDFLARYSFLKQSAKVVIWFDHLPDLEGGYLPAYRE